MDIEKLLSPTGGYNYGDTINTGAAGLGMAFMSGPLFDSFVMKPAEKYMKRQRALNYLRHPHVRATDLTLGQRPLTVDVPSDYPPGARYNPPDDSAASRRAGRANVQGANSARRTELKNVLRSEFKDWKSKFSKGRSVFKAAGWATLISLGVDLAVEAGTPGVSKAAARQDEKFMMKQQRMDSPAAFTMRQRAVEAIHNSMMSTRNVMGNEAQFMHR